MGDERVKDARYSLKKHGHWVRHKVLRNEGLISYYDRVNRLVAVVWPPSTYVGQTKKELQWYFKRGWSAGLYVPSELTLLKQWEPEPWFKRAQKEALSKRT